MRRRAVALAGALGALAVFAAPAQGSVSVTTTTDEVAANSSCSLREAITMVDGTDLTNYGCTDTATDPNTINLPASATPYKLTIHGIGNDTNATGDLDVEHDMTIQGAGAGGTIIDGDAADRVFDVFGSFTVAINGVTIENGRAPDAASSTADGGGILVGPGITLSLRDDVVAHNAAGNGSASDAAGSGGGIASKGNLTVIDTSVDHNAAGSRGTSAAGGFGGGISSISSGFLSVDSSTIATNHAGDGSSTGGFGAAGGGIYANNNGSTTVTASTIDGNSAGSAHSSQGGGSGGGIFDVNALTLTNSTVADNDAGDSSGGGGGNGGGVETGAGPATLMNDTIAGNGAGAGTMTGNGAEYFAGPGSNDKVSNTILASSTRGPNCGMFAFTDMGHNLSFADSIPSCPGGFGTGDPKLGPLAGNGGPTETMAISSSGAAYDAVPPTVVGCPAADQRGVPRPQGTACDVGAFELRRFNLTVSKAGKGTGSVTSSPAGIVCGGACSAQLDEATLVTLTPKPGPGSTFSGWSGGGCSGTGACTVALNANTTVSATFAATPPPASPPNTKIKKAKISQAKNSAKFTFKSIGGSKAKATRGFQCALVKKKHKKPKFKACKSPKTYKHLKPRKYTFEVRAFDADGKDATPAKKQFRIK